MDWSSKGFGSVPSIGERERKLCSVVFMWLLSYRLPFVPHDFGQVGEVCSASVSPSLSGDYETNDI